MGDPLREKQRRRLEQLKSKVQPQSGPVRRPSVPDLIVPDSVKMPAKKKQKAPSKPRPARIRRKRGDEEDTHYA